MHPCSLQHCLQCLWKQPIYLSIDDKMKMWYIYIMEYYSAIKKDEIMHSAFATIWMDLEIIILSEASLIEKDKYHIVSHILNIKN